MYNLFEENSVQQFVEAIASNINVDISVLDKDRTVVAGTGWIKDDVGKQYDQYCLTSRLLQSDKAYYVKKPGHSKECEPCKRYGICESSAVVALPIRKNNKILGSLCLEPTSEKQTQTLLNNKQTLNFLEKMCVLIFDALNENEVKNELTILLETYSKVISTVHEGIIITDNNGRIIQYNVNAIKLLELDQEEIINQPVSKVVPNVFYRKLDKKQSETKIAYNFKGIKKQLYIATEKITDSHNSQFWGTIITIRSLNEVSAMTSRLNHNYSKYSFDDIKGESDVINNVKEKLKKAALTDSTILIRGESGTGKELFAHAVHTASNRADNSFIAINCSAIPDALLESELFGYEEGAFTGARKGGKPGKLELVKGGTIFLDEIGDMPLHLQSKLLRVIENRVIERVGGTDQLLVDIRFIAATHRNLEKMVANNEFRSDLYYRLSVIPILIPPLRERKSDIPILINAFLEEYSNKMNILQPAIDDQVKKILLNYLWPGNVRELQNAIQYLISMSQDEPCITTKHLPHKFLETATFDQSHKMDLKLNNEGRLRSIELEEVNRAIKKFGNTTEGKLKAAKYLGISLTTLYRKLKEINNSNVY